MKWINQKARSFRLSMLVAFWCFTNRNILM